ncbi:putative membrane protein (plasmid) [Bacillus thuringiensis HD1002]|nr:putative membrane protein [Bacillus thuringiensis HD1002]
MNKKVLTALALSIPVFISTGNMASTQINTQLT